MDLLFLCPCRVHLPPIGRPITREWLDDYEPDCDEDCTTTSIFGIGLDPDLDIVEPPSGRILIYQNGGKTFLLHVDRVEKDHHHSSKNSNNNTGGGGDLSDRLKENVNMMRKLQGLKGRMSDQVNNFANYNYDHLAVHALHTI